MVEITLEEALRRLKDTIENPNNSNEAKYVEIQEVCKKLYNNAFWNGQEDVLRKEYGV